ncbi:MAG: hypothetical protein M1816_007602 [Peltula sp. TS41687]|nr:MAG: hypothetical protein M1816_007602 [Peltula sp. TS41687]
MLKQSSLAPTASALRVLRTLAVIGTLGTTAVFVEDRRRRIRLLSQMQHNAKLLKSNPRYSPSAVQRVRALADEARLDEAEAVLVSALENPSPSPALERCYTDLLGRMWRSTKDLNQTKALFGRLEAHFGHVRPSVIVFNQMIQSCMEAKDHAAASNYLRLMTETYQLEPNLKTLGRLLLQHAQKRCWTAVEEGFREMKERFGHQETYANDFTAVFNPILREYVNFEGRKTSKMLQFVNNATEQYDLIPDRYTSNMLLTTCLKYGQISPLVEWLIVAEKFDLRLDAGTVKTLMRQNWNQPARARELLEKLNGLDQGLVDQDCKKYVQDLITSSSWGQELRGDLAPIGDEHSKQTPGEKLLAEMRRFRMHGDPAAAVQLYRAAHEKGIKTSQRVLAEAATAFSETPECGDIAAAESFLRSASYTGQELHVALVPLLMQRVRHCVQWEGFEEIRRVVLGFYNLLQAKRVPIVHHLTSKAAHLLVTARRPEYALSLLREVQSSGWSTKAAFDIVVMTAYLQIYTAMHSIEGIRWTVLQTVGLFHEIDRIFFRTLEAACRALAKWSQTLTIDPVERAENFLILRQCLVWTRARMDTQQRAMDMLQSVSVELFLHGRRGQLISSKSVDPVHASFPAVWRPRLEQYEKAHELTPEERQEQPPSEWTLRPSDYLQIGNDILQQGSLKVYLELPQGKPTRAEPEATSLVGMDSVDVQKQYQRSIYANDGGSLRSSAAGG